MPDREPRRSYGGVRICSGSVPSFDGAKMDVDLTQPSAGTGRRHPLIIMLHGFGNDKHEWESTNDEADGADKLPLEQPLVRDARLLRAELHGARLLGTTGPARTMSRPRRATRAAPSAFRAARSTSRAATSRSATPSGSRRWSPATYRDVDPDRVAVTGGSYGGIESWLQASQPTWTFPHSLDASLPILNLQVAVPKYPSTDLAYALAPNGHGGGPALSDLYESSQGRPDDDQGDGNPIGVPKESYVTGLFALGETKGVFEKGTSTDAPFPCTYGDCEGTVNIESWKARTDAGDPTAPEDPIIRQIRRGLTEFRGPTTRTRAGGKQVDGRKVAVFSIQGWTDDLFPAVESFRIFKYLKRLDPRWPVEVALADVGHSRAQNKPDTWRPLNARAFQWLQSNIGGSREQRTTCPARRRCAATAALPRRRWPRRRRGWRTARFRSTTREGRPSRRSAWRTRTVPPPTRSPAPVRSRARRAVTRMGRCPRAPGTRPTRSRSSSRRTWASGTCACRTPGPERPAATWMPASSTWRPDGAELLITRGTYRLENDPLAGVIALPFYGNHWRIELGTGSASTSRRWTSRRTGRATSRARSGSSRV